MILDDQDRVVSFSTCLLSKDTVFACTTSTYPFLEFVILLPEDNWGILINRPAYKARRGREDAYELILEGS